MPKVLFIAYTFPPLSGSGVQRTSKFVKYLPEFGWQPIVLTVSGETSVEVDHSLMEELPNELPVYRAPDINLVYFLRRVVSRLSSASDQRLVERRSNSKNQTSNISPLRQAWRNFVETWLMIPDHYIYWFPAALWIGLRIVKQCDIIYSTSAPFTDHLVAYVLHKLSGKPWISDFRDPWKQLLIYQHPSRLRSRIDAFLEELFVQNSIKVCLTCPATTLSFQTTYPHLPRDKFIEITNGFDAQDFTQPVYPPFDCFTIVYAGRNDRIIHVSSAFFQALRELVHEHSEFVSKIQVLFAGAFEDQICDHLKEGHLEDIVKPMGYVSHTESIKLILQSDALLLILNDIPGTNLVYPGKLFEYLAAGKTILALVPEGATADLIRDMGAGLVIPPTDVSAIKQAILDLYNQYKQGITLSKTYDNLERFERRTLTRHLAQCLDAVFLAANKADPI